MIDHLQKKCINIVHIDCGVLPKEKADEHILKISRKIKAMDIHDEYKFILVRKR